MDTFVESTTISCPTSTTHGDAGLAAGEVVFGHDHPRKGVVRIPDLDSHVGVAQVVSGHGEVARELQGQIPGEPGDRGVLDPSVRDLDETDARETETRRLVDVHIPDDETRAGV